VTRLCESVRHESNLSIGATTQPYRTRAVKDPLGAGSAFLEPWAGDVYGGVSTLRECP